ncbi:Nicotianamine synthase [Boeremia exigua]|uniref:Nicotianamine synthase n=1 Tax=Boeremia exigua TaxID=749465 RepID=UPI001E8DA0E8|nr:Nicotianamine synthase [Boeremia exigua]KAH6639279.1 Nicotianamine synthase [Boeremia exigua]
MLTDGQMASMMDGVPKTEKPKPSEHTITQSTPQTPPRTPPLIAASSQTLASEIRNIYQALTELPNLVPGDGVNALLTRLVSLCVVLYTDEFTTYFFNIKGMRTICEQLRPLCATAEGELEHFWARTIVEESLKTNATPTQTQALLTTFPYHQNYVDLSRVECATVAAFLPPSSAPENIAFIGSGPLPLTSLCILDIFPSARVHNVDRDFTALSVSRDLCARLGHAGRMSFACADVSVEENRDEDMVKWSDFDVVFLAALVGMNTLSKLAILAGLVKRLRPGAFVVARSAKGLRAVLYPVLELGEDLDKIGLEMLVEVHPWTKVVNSVIVFRVKEVARP